MLLREYPNQQYNEILNYITNLKTESLGDFCLDLIYKFKSNDIKIWKHIETIVEKEYEYIQENVLAQIFYSATNIYFSLISQNTKKKIRERIFNSIQNSNDISKIVFLSFSFRNYREHYKNDLLELLKRKLIHFKNDFFTTKLNNQQLVSMIFCLGNSRPRLNDFYSKEMQSKLD